MNNKSKSTGKSRFHKNNLHKEGYDFEGMIKSHPDLKPHVKENKFGNESIDFADPKAVFELNHGLLKHHYDVNGWQLPENALCPPIPGRADYIHHVSDLLRIKNFGKLPEGGRVRCLDIGVGANCIYPILGHQIMGWKFLGADISESSLDNAQAILHQNPDLKENIELVHQTNSKDIFYGILQKEDRFDISLCNPPFHASSAAAKEGSQRKLKNLNLDVSEKPTLNFGGQDHELWCDGGELQFVRQMIRQSKNFSKSCFWFTTLVSKQSNVSNLIQAIRSADATEVKEIPMGTGNKSTRVLAWTFLSEEEQKEWREMRWEI